MFFYVCLMYFFFSHSNPLKNAWAGRGMDSCILSNSKVLDWFNFCCLRQYSSTLVTKIYVQFMASVNEKHGRQPSIHRSRFLVRSSHCDQICREAIFRGVLTRQSKMRIQRTQSKLIILIGAVQPAWKIYDILTQDSPPIFSNRNKESEYHTHFSQWVLVPMIEPKCCQPIPWVLHEFKFMFVVRTIPSEVVIWTHILNPFCICCRRPSNKWVWKEGNEKSRGEYRVNHHFSHKLCHLVCLLRLPPLVCVARAFQRGLLWLETGLHGAAREGRERGRDHRAEPKQIPAKVPEGPSASWVLTFLAHKLTYVDISYIIYQA